MYRCMEASRPLGRVRCRTPQLQQLTGGKPGRQLGGPVPAARPAEVTQLQRRVQYSAALQPGQKAQKNGRTSEQLISGWGAVRAGARGRRGDGRGVRGVRGRGCLVI